ncbi:MAG: FAD-dependent oxidoreductase [Bacteroidota bacterium]|nr:FAD-dependent oxidoreductase [Bacteroidota bacterium]
MQNKNIIIIGNGISGVTAARHIRKRSSHKITIISSESDYFYSRTALMYVFMGHMRYEHTKPYEDYFWSKNNIGLIKDYVENIDFRQKILHLREGADLSYDILILATGSKYNRPDWAGIDLMGVQGLVNLQDLELMEINTNGVSEAVIVGGGLIGIEMAEMLKTRSINVTMLVREDNFWGNILPEAEAKLIKGHIVEHGINLKLNTQLKEILGDDNKVVGVTTGTGERIPCGFVGVAVGVSPNIGFLENSTLNTSKGILINEYFETNIHDVYAIGDCAEFTEALQGRMSIEQVWYTGRMHGETLALTLCGKKTAYNPGPWFNSAKFIDIEYQVYGKISNTVPEDETHLFWKHESGKKSIRIAFKKESFIVVGINLLGIRYRHEVCDRWLQGKATIQEVLRKLKEANFDPEFHKKHEKEIVEQFEIQIWGDNLPKKQKRRFGFL